MHHTNIALFTSIVSVILGFLGIWIYLFAALSAAWKGNKPKARRIGVVTAVMLLASIGFGIHVFSWACILLTTAGIATFFFSSTVSDPDKSWRIMSLALFILIIDVNIVR